MKYEYGEPVERSQYEPGSINQSDGMFFMWLSDDQRRHRIIACINACAGISNEDLEKIGLGGVAKIMAEIMPTDIASAVRGVGQAAKNVYGNNSPVAGPPLTPEQAAEWEWTGEKPRKLGNGESGIRSHCDRTNCCKPGCILKSNFDGETHSFYWPLRRRQQPKAEEPTTPQNATLDDIAALLRRILDRMPKTEVE